MSTFAHYELNTSDPQAAKKFYQSVFGWKAQDMNMPSGVYTMLQAAAEPFAGLQANPMKDSGPHWLAYVTVPSLTRTLTKAKKQGAKVVMPTIEVPGMGKYAVFTDPQGAAIGIWEAAAPATKKATKKAAKKNTKEKAKKSAKKAAKKAGKNVEKSLKKAGTKARKAAKTAKKRVAKAAKKTAKSAKKTAKRVQKKVMKTARSKKNAAKKQAG
ncbi:MAG: VOC family protein, partial [Myxococcota bacterium]